MATKAAITMDELLSNEEAEVKQLIAGEPVSGTVLSVRKNEVLVDLGPRGVVRLSDAEPAARRNTFESGVRTRRRTHRLGPSPSE